MQNFASLGEKSIMIWNFWEIFYIFHEKISMENWCLTLFLRFSRVPEAAGEFLAFFGWGGDFPGGGNSGGLCRVPPAVPPCQALMPMYVFLWFLRAWGETPFSLWPSMPEFKAESAWPSGWTGGNKRNDGVRGQLWNFVWWLSARAVKSSGMQILWKPNKRNFQRFVQKIC